MLFVQYFGVSLSLAIAVSAFPKPFTPYEPPHFGGADANNDDGGFKLMLKRTPDTTDGTHVEIARVQAVNRAFKKFSKR